MTRKVWSILGRLIVVTVSVILIVAHLVIWSWYWRASEKLRLERELKRLSMQVADLYNTQVREMRRLRAITRLVHDREDFPVTSGNEIVSCVVPVPAQTKRPDSGGSADEVLAVFVYIPPGNHRLMYSFREFWTETERMGLDDYHGYGPKAKSGWEKNAVTVALPTGEVHEVAFSVEQDGEKTLLRVSVPGHHERSFPLPPCTVLRREGYGYSHFNKTVPNQHLNELDEDNHLGVWHRWEIMPNELLYHAMMLQRRSHIAQRSSGGSSKYGPGDGELRLCCWIESDVPASVSAALVAAHGKGFIDQQRVTRPAAGGPFGAIGGPVPDVDKLFKPYDRSGDLYYEVSPAR